VPSLSESEGSRAITDSAESYQVPERSVLCLLVASIRLSLLPGQHHCFFSGQSARNGPVHDVWFSARFFTRLSSHKTHLACSMKSHLSMDIIFTFFPSRGKDRQRCVEIPSLPPRAVYTASHSTPYECPLRCFVRCCRAQRQAAGRRSLTSRSVSPVEMSVCRLCLVYLV